MRTIKYYEDIQGELARLLSMHSWDIHRLSLFELDEIELLIGNYEMNARLELRRNDPTKRIILDLIKISNVVFSSGIGPNIPLTLPAIEIDKIGNQFFFVIETEDDSTRLKLHCEDILYSCINVP